ncbi:hypothetical protein BYT27DRAFT_7190893 [Phlegmacium glaucopus]|nr:hypothetical protein BYT27DRAFT_7190893 [Phlegmacium glaucopus]
MGNVLVSRLKFHVHLTNELIEIAKGYLSMVFNPSQGKISPDECISLKKYEMEDVQ